MVAELLENSYSLKNIFFFYLEGLSKLRINDGKSPEEGDECFTCVPSVLAEGQID